MLSSPRYVFAVVVAVSYLFTLHAALAVGSDQQPGQKIQVDPRALPAPYSPPSRAHRSRTVAKPADATLRVPQGFTAAVFAENLGDARTLRVAPNGDVFLAVSGQNKVLIMGDDGGKAKNVRVFADGFNHPSGLAFTGNALLVADFDGVWKIPYSPGDEKARAKPIRITPQGALGDPGGHSTRTLIVSPDGSKFYVAIGSRGNIAEEPEPRATIQEFAMDGSRQRTFAKGLRNPIGMQFYPGTSDLYTVVNERDTLGDELVPDYLTVVADGGFYGWPYAYLGTNPQPKFADLRPDLIAKSTMPNVLFRSHSAPIDLVFYTAKQFPAQYRGGAFVTLRGSWNASTPRGYNVAYVKFDGGKPENAYTVFASGFWISGESPAEVWGRPTGIAVAKDGSLLIADDVSGSVWRVSYKGSERQKPRGNHGGRTMPSVLIEVRKQYPPEQETALMEAVHLALREAFKILPGDKNVRLQVHEPHRFACPPNRAQPDLYTHISIDCFVGRSLEAKRRLYRAIVDNLEELGIPKDHVKILLREITAENWGIRGGQAASDIDLGFKVDV